MSNEMRKLFTGTLSAEDMDRVLSIVKKAILWRGWDKSARERNHTIPSHAEQAILEIVELFRERGIELEEYT